MIAAGLAQQNTTSVLCVFCDKTGPLHDNTMTAFTVRTQEEEHMESTEGVR